MKNNNKNIHFFAIAALAATLMAGQVQVSPVYADSASVQLASLIPDNVTVEQPVPLSEISLPDNEYGTLSWVDDSSVPSERVQSYEVVFKPYDSSILSQISGWDGESDVIYSSVTVVVSSMETSSGDSDEWKDDSDENYDESYDENYDESENENAEKQDNYEEKQDSAENEENQGAESENQAEDPADNGENTDAEVTETPSEEETEDSSVSEKTDKEDKEAETGEAEETEDQKSDNKNNKTEDSSTEETKSEETETDPTETPKATETPEVTAVPEVTVTPEADKDNIFDGTDKEIKEDDRSTEFEEDLTDDQKATLAEENHSANGITVSGIDLPYYVQFRVSSGDDYEFTNESEANVFQSYEFELWDLKNNTEYQVPDGEYISVTVPVKAGYSYTIEHILDSGAMETIVPSVDGSTMIFSTHSFSPFGIAGSKTLVGEEIEEDGYDTGVVTETPDAVGSADLTPVADDNTDDSSTASDTADTATGTDSSAADSTNAEVTSVPEDSSAQTSSESSSEEDQNSDEDNSSSVKAVHTGDTTHILPFVILAIAAAAIVGVIVYLRKRKK